MAISQSHLEPYAAVKQMAGRAVILVTEPAVWLCLGLFFNISGLTDYVPALSSLETMIFAAGLTTVGTRLWMGTWGYGKTDNTWIPVICAIGFGLLSPSLVTSILAGHNLSVLEDFGWRHFAKFIILVTLCLSVYPNGKQRRWLVGTLELSLATLAVSVLYRFHILDQFNVESGRMELMGRHGDPNFACLFMTIGMVLSLERFTEAKTTALRTLHASAALLFLITAWFTESRAGLAIMAVVGLGSLLLFPFGKLRKYLFIAIPLIVVICLAAFGDRIVDRYMSIDDASNSGRIAGIKATIDMIVEHPFFGHGYNSSSRFVGRYQDTLFASGSIALEIHTTPLQIAGELGLFGLLTYGALYASLIALAFAKLHRTKNMPHASVATVLIATTILMNMISIPMTYIGTVHGIALVLLFTELTPPKENG